MSEEVLTTQLNVWDGLTGFCCATCRFFAPKKKESTLGRCRRNAPTMLGYPAVHADLDWCGEHKLGTNPTKEAFEMKN